MRFLRCVLVSLTAMLAHPASADMTGTLRQAHDVGKGALSSLDPASPGTVLSITEKVMSRLIRPGPDGRPAADLATDWHAEEDGRVWTFALRDNVRFHDGKPFEAQDAAYSLNRVLDPDRDAPARAVIDMIETVEIPEPMTLRLTLKTPFADLPLQLMDPRLRIIPDGSGEDIGQTGVGTGPFMVKSFDADGTTILVANPDYFEGTPKLAEIQVIGIPDANTRLQAFLAGQIDMERGIRPLMRRALARSDRYRIQDIPTGNWSGLVFRNDVPPFDDVRVRRAIRMAVDRSTMLKLALDGGGILSCDTPVAPNDQYRAALDCPRDVDGARALLAEAGYADGIDIRLYVAPLDGVWSSMAVVFQQQAAEVGIRVELVNAAADGYWSDIWMKKDAFATSWGERPADQVLSEAFGMDAKMNESRYEDPVFDTLIKEARADTDFYERRDAYIAAQQHLADTSGTLIPFHRSQLVALSPRVLNMPPVRSDRIPWHQVDVATDDS
ncbi:MAG: ABC transporter substrate-binding protein [Pseudomonadota bacterium]